MKNYYRIMPGQKSVYAQECLKGNFIGTDFNIHQDLSKELTDNWKHFNKKFIPIYLEGHPEKAKVAAGLACGAIWTVSKYLKRGDIVLCPNGEGSYMIGEIAGDYYYQAGGILQHRRPIKWYNKSISRDGMSQSLKYSTGAIGTISDNTKHAEEIERLIGDERPATLISTDQTVEDPSVFALENHLEDFLFQNWKQTELGKTYEIYEDENGTGKQYVTDDNGRIDILAISKDKKELLVVELKKGRASDVVVGQVQRYMGYVKEVIAEKNQTVKGIIIALEDDQKLKRALSVASNIEFYKYQVSFKLYK